MKINLSDIPKVCHCNASFLDSEALTTLEDGYERLRRSEASTPLRKHLSIKVYKLLKYKSTQLGASLLDVVQLGLRRHNSPTGAVLPDQYAYDTFKLLLDQLLEERHLGFDPYTDVQPPVNWGDWSRLNDLDPEEKFIQRVCVSASFNLNGFRFTPTMTRNDLRSVEDAVVLSLMKLPGEYAGTYDYIQCMTPDRKKELASIGCLFHCGDKNDHAANVPKFWSYGRGVYVNDDKTFAAWVNAKDHVRVFAQAEGGQLQDAYRRLAEVMPYLDCRLRPARHPRLGKLTVSLDDVGSGVSVAADVVLRAMPNPMLDKIAKVYRLEIRCLEENLYQVSKRSHLGYTEFEVVRDFNHGLRELLYMASFLEVKSEESLIQKDEDKVEKVQKDDKGSGDHPRELKGTKPEEDQEPLSRTEELRRRRHERMEERKRRHLKNKEERKRRRLKREEERKREKLEHDKERKRKQLEREEERNRQHKLKEDRKRQRLEEHEERKRRRHKREEERKRPHLKRKEERKRQELQDEKERERQHKPKEERKQQRLEEEEERERRHREQKEEIKRKKREQEEERERKRLEHEEERKRRKREEEEERERLRLEQEEERKRRHELKEKSKQQRLEEEEERKRQQQKKEEELKRKKREHKEKRKEQELEKEKERKRRKHEHKVKHEEKRRLRRELEKKEKEELQRRYAREKEEREMMYARLRHVGHRKKN